MVDETFKCAFLEHGVTFYSDGMVGPCCQIDYNYREPNEHIRDKNRFSNIKENYKEACKTCLNAERKGLKSYRQSQDKFYNDNKLRYLDIRTTNKCNLICRMCDPFYSDKWGKELNVKNPLVQVDISEFDDIVFSDDVKWIYFTGGEPLINPKHWEILQVLVDSGKSKHIQLQYNTNMTTAKYKKIDIFTLWSQFKSVFVLGSIDAIGKELEYIRSGAKWETIDKHINVFNEYKNSTSPDFDFIFEIHLTLTIMNIWSIEKILDYFNKLNIKVNVQILTGPDILALNVIPDSLQQEALDILYKVKSANPEVFSSAISEVKNNINKVLFEKTMLFTILLDNKRNEDLFNLLPVSDEATKTVGSR